MEEFSLILFGATGDLSRLKLLPAIYDLKKRGLLPGNFSLIGNGRREHSDESFRKYVKSVWKEKHEDKFDEKVADGLLKSVFYYRGDLADAQMYRELEGHLKTLLDKGVECGNRVFHLAVLPALYKDVANKLGESGLNKSPCGWTKILLEKPFGSDLRSAQELDKCLKGYFEESQIYRIDHYLAKETVQNILYFRFANEMFEPTLNNKFVDHIQITIAEEFGIKDRGKFYDRTGAVRDVLQNHMLQVLATVTMDQPEKLDAGGIRRERQNVLASLAECDLSKVVAGQYEGYLGENDVPEDSRTETFVAMRTEINTPRWQGVPVYIRHGKGLARTVSEVNIVYKDNALKPSPNVMTFRLSPHESIVLRFFVTKPGPTTELAPANLQFHYHQLGGELMAAYEKVLLDAFSGNQTLFTMAEGVEAEWRFVDPMLKQWESMKSVPLRYKKGSWGPGEVEKLIKSEGREWLEPSVDLEFEG